MKTQTPTVYPLTEKLIQHQQQLRNCTRCPSMIRPVITGEPAASPIMLIGQAPGIHEGKVGKPFGWTAGKTLFQWFASIGIAEEEFRQKIYMAAVCRCFPGKQIQRNGKTGGGDRVPNKTEIANCRSWMQSEFELLQPRLIIPVGKLAISQLLTVNKLQDIIGQAHRIEIFGQETDVIPLPHPSGASTWHRMEPGKTLLTQALQAIENHRTWQNILRIRN